MQPLMQFKSHVAGKNADVVIYPDRIEWAQEQSATAKVTKAAMTAGISLLRSGQRGSEVIPIKSVSSVATKKDGFRTAVSVICSGNTIDFRVGGNEAQRIKDLLMSLVLGNHPSQQPGAQHAHLPAPPPPPPGYGQPAPPPPPPPPAEPVSLADELKKLADLRDAGVLTADEFDAQKARLLSG